MRELFVYYRVPEAEAAAAQRDIESLQAELRGAHAGLEARLLRRPAASNGVQTWMEIYQRPGHALGIDESLQADIEARAARRARHFEGPRHVEVFVGMAPT